MTRTGVDTRQLQERAVTGGILGVGSAKGDLIVYNGTTHQRREVGGDGTALLADSGTTHGLRWGIPWAWDHVSYIAVPTAMSSVDFTGTEIDGQNGEYLICFEGVSMDTDGVELALRLHENNASWRNGTSDYSWSNDGSSTGVNLGFSDTGDSEMALTTTGSYRPGSAPDESLSGWVHIYRPTDSNLRTLCRWNTVYVNLNGEQTIVYGVGMRTTGEINDGFRIFPKSGNLHSGTFTLYQRLS